MAKVASKILKTGDELLAFQQASAGRIGVELPLDYLEKAQVLGLFEPKSQKLCGGFVLAYQSGLRCLEQIPKNLGLPISSDKMKRCFEINALWIDHSSAPTGSRLTLYLLCIRKALKLLPQGKFRYVYAYCSENTKLREFYSNFYSVKIYEGPVTLLPGMGEACEEVVEMGDLRKLPLLLARNSTFLLKRMPVFQDLQRVRVGSFLTAYRPSLF